MLKQERKGKGIIRFVLKNQMILFDLNIEASVFFLCYDFNALVWYNVIELPLWMYMFQLCVFLVDYSIAL